VPFTGGKFINNCLYLSKHVLPPLIKEEQYLFENPTDYQYRYDLCLKTLPPKNRMLQWIENFEINDAPFYKIRNSALAVDRGWYEGKYTFNKRIARISNSGFKTTCVTHRPETLSHIRKVWPNMHLIMMYNGENFFKKSIKLKSNKQITFYDVAGAHNSKSYNVLKGCDWPSFEEFLSAKYNPNNLKCSEHIKNEIANYYYVHKCNVGSYINVDKTFFDKSQFIDMMQQVYKEIGLDDFNKELVSLFYEKYIKLHEEIYV
jgi:hypothetical protein